MTILKPNLLRFQMDTNMRRVRRILFKIKKRITGITRPTSYPYVTGDSFRVLANHIHDETGTFDPNTVKRGDIVFVGQDYVLSYMQQIHPLISEKYILICHNSDTPVNQAIVDLIDEKIIRFYAQDVTHDHDKIIPIPIGIENYHFRINGVTSIFTKLRKKLEKNSPRQNRIFFKFSLNTNPKERTPALELFEKHPVMDTVSFMISPKMHLETLMTYKFVASPPGNAIESIRTWKALYMKTVPIVKDFVAMRYFVSIGLPMWIVKDWKELEGLTERDLERKYDALIKSARWDALHMDFWIKMIRKDQENVRSIDK